jgi:L-aminopeptidase/D-esterase-like protein
VTDPRQPAPRAHGNPGGQATRPGPGPPVRRNPGALERDVTSGSHYSGDLFLAFSTGNPGGFGPHHPQAGERAYDTLTFIPWGFMNPFFAAAVQGTEEAVANALVANEEMTGRNGRRSPALPRDRVAALFRAGRA